MENSVISKIVLAHHFVSPPGWYSRAYARKRLYSGIVFVQDGYADYIMADGKRFSVHRGDCLYIPKGSMYTTKCNAKESFTHMTVNFEVLEGRDFYPNLYRQKLSHPNHFEQLFAKLIRYWTVRHPHYQVRCTGVLCEMIYTLLKEITEPGDPYMDKVLPARRYLDEHFQEDFELTQLADLCGLSETYFRRLFLRVFHETPTEYRRRLRITCAQDLLLSGNCTVTQAAEYCGYSDPAYFSRVFRKTVGISPMQFLEERLKLENG